MSIYPEFIAKFRAAPMIMGDGPDSDASANAGSDIVTEPKTRNPKSPKDLGGQFKVSGKSATGTARWFYKLCTVSGGAIMSPFTSETYVDGTSTDINNDICLALYAKVISHDGSTHGATNFANYNLQGWPLPNRERNMSGVSINTSRTTSSYDGNASKDGNVYILRGQAVALKMPVPGDFVAMEPCYLKYVILDEMSDGTSSTAIVEFAALCDDVA